MREKYFLFELFKNDDIINEMKRLKLKYREFVNYLYIRKVIKRESASADQNSTWNKLKLRSTPFGLIYTVVSLREQDMGEEDIVQKWKAMEMMRPINEYLTSLDLQELVFPSIELIENTRSYLVVYSPMFNELTIKWIITRFLMILMSITGLILYICFEK